MDDRMIVTATTNQGVDNAVEKIAELSPGFNISREMSKKGEDGVGQVSFYTPSMPNEQFSGAGEVLPRLPEPQIETDRSRPIGSPGSV